MSAPEPGLKRSLSLGLVVFYGLGTILGAGIYVLIGAVAAAAGPHLALSFLVAAVIAGFTAFTYAELVARYPLSAGEAAYVDAAFQRDAFTLAVGMAVVTVGVVSAATIANGFAAYLGVFVTVPDDFAVASIVVVLGALAAFGIEASVWVAAAFTVCEIVGLLLVIAVAGDGLVSGAAMAALVPPADVAGWAGIGSGAFLAFYAFIGFEDMVNIAEEVRAPERNVTRAIVIALFAATGLYVLVALTVVTAIPLADLAGDEAPLALVVASRGVDPRFIAAISLIAIVNGALVQIIMASRVLFGLARQGRLPATLGRVEASTRTPVAATVVVTAVVLAFAVALPLVELASITSFVTLTVFAAVNAALIRIRRRDGADLTRFRCPLWVPGLGLALSVALAGFQLAQ